MDMPSVSHRQQGYWNTKDTFVRTEEYLRENTFMASVKKDEFDRD